MTARTFPARDLGPSLVLATAVAPEAQALIIGVTNADNELQLLIDSEALPEGLWDELFQQLEAVGAKGKTDEVTRIPAPADLGVASVIAVGLGSADNAGDPEAVRRAAGVAARALSGLTHVATTLSLLSIEGAAEGLFLGSYTYNEFKTADAPAPLARVDLLVSEADASAESTLERSVAVATAVATARELVNTPPSHLYPEEFAERARLLGEATGLAVTILDEVQLATQGFGGIVGVGKGSSRQPRLVTLAHRGGVEGAPTVALVGKGITFDTGGISIKPAAGMEHMTSDMGGAAAVVATIALVAKLNLPLNVTAYVPMAENMPSATAQRPGDVLTQYGGTTVEVINTDAEGRLVLADAIALACEANPTYLIDTATLTGAQMVALGNRTPGVMGTDEFRDRVAKISQGVGENAWAMPLPAELRPDLDSRVADLANVTNHRWGGMLSAALFLKEFVAEGVQWAHLDVAGPAFNTGGPFGYTGKGGTGVPVRTIIGVLEDIVAKG
ncbi:leucyl aminopeptidase [Tomitella biformata]|uniref:leucyl aminopeptidase n=1 Tax=Tomitella biformata TaxID=630403 RepID=UPI000464C3A1|nr:leucyl aminopeptidase [Tomitella biformata]